MDDEQTFAQSLICHCTVPSPWMHLGEDTGLCRACRLVYDQRLYEMRLRQHVPRHLYESVRDYLSSGVRA